MRVLLVDACGSNPLERFRYKCFESMTFALFRKPAVLTFSEVTFVKRTKSQLLDFLDEPTSNHNNHLAKKKFSAIDMVLIASSPNYTPWMGCFEQVDTLIRMCLRYNKLLFCNFTAANSIIAALTIGDIRHQLYDLRSEKALKGWKEGDDSSQEIMYLDSNDGSMYLKQTVGADSQLRMCGNIGLYNFTATTNNHENTVKAKRFANFKNAVTKKTIGSGPTDTVVGKTEETIGYVVCSKHYLVENVPHRFIVSSPTKWRLLPTAITECEFVVNSPKGPLMFQHGTVVGCYFNLDSNPVTGTIYENFILKGCEHVYCASKYDQLVYEEKIYPKKKTSAKSLNQGKMHFSICNWVQKVNKRNLENLGPIADVSVDLSHSHFYEDPTIRFPQTPKTPRSTTTSGRKTASGISGRVHAVLTPNNFFSPASCRKSVFTAGEVTAAENKLLLQTKALRNEPQREASPLYRDGMTEGGYNQYTPSIAMTSVNHHEANSAGVVTFLENSGMRSRNHCLSGNRRLHVPTMTKPIECKTPVRPPQTRVHVPNGEIFSLRAMRNLSWMSDSMKSIMNSTRKNNSEESGITKTRTKENTRLRKKTSHTQDPNKYCLSADNCFVVDICANEYDLS